MYSLSNTFLLSEFWSNITENFICYFNLIKEQINPLWSFCTFIGVKGQRRCQFMFLWLNSNININNVDFI